MAVPGRLMSLLITAQQVVESGIFGEVRCGSIPSIPPRPRHATGRTGRHPNCELRPSYSSRIGLDFQRKKR